MRRLWESHRFAVTSLGCFIALVLILFPKAHWPGATQALGRAEFDLQTIIAPFLRFGFGELARGNLALWNPHIYCGTPFLGNAQSALLYPPNWLNLVLPTAAAVNLGIALHIVLCGWFVSLWCRGRGISAVASVLAGVIYVCSAPIFVRIYVGHLTLLHAITWTPLLFLVVDRLLDGPRLSWVLTGTFALAMAMLSGHPQVVYYTLLAAGLYLLMQLPRAQGRTRVTAAFVVVCVGAAMIAAVQLMTTSQAVAESSRAGGVSYAFATQNSLMPQFLVTLVAPEVLGGTESNVLNSPFWELSAYAGVVTFLLAGHGAIAGTTARRGIIVTLAVLFLVLAMGGFTPLYRLFFHVVPGFSLQRIPARFMLIACLFMVMLAAEGLDALKRGSPRWWLTALPALIIAGGSFVLAVWLRAQIAQHEGGAWGELLRQDGALDLDAVTRSGAWASRQLTHAAVIALFAAVFMALSQHWRRAVYLVALLAALEMVWFAHQRVAWTNIEPPYPSAWALSSSLAAKAQNRVGTFHNAFKNAGMCLGHDDVSGLDPIILKRYSDYLSATQGLPLDEQFFAPNLSRPAPALALVRCQAFLSLDGGDARVEPPAATPLGRLQLVGTATVMSDRVAILSALLSPTFDGRREVILEQAPDPLPQGVSSGDEATVVRAETDELEIRAKVERPCILLITDSYSAGWRAEALADSAQRSYRIMPANYALRAIPLTAGSHHLLLRFAPWQYRVGGWISVISLALFAASCGFAVVRSIKAPAGS